MMMAPKQHWQAIHEENAARDVSWFQEAPRASLGWIEKIGTPMDARILDVGCGQWGLPGALLERGFTRVRALDISAEALRKAREAMGPRGASVEWVEADALDYSSPDPVDVWHDRAVLHFFTGEADQRRYAEAARRNVAAGGHLIIGTFALDGPEKCSGLPVKRQDAAGIGRILGPGFQLRDESRETHVTPWGKTQAFQWAVFQRL